MWIKNKFRKKKSGGYWLKSELAWDTHSECISPVLSWIKHPQLNIKKSICSSCCCKLDMISGDYKICLKRRWTISPCILNIKNETLIVDNSLCTSSAFQAEFWWRRIRIKKVFSQMVNQQTCLFVVQDC